MADRDIELNILNLKEDSLAHGSSYSMREPVYDIPRRPGAVQRWLDTFRRDPTQRITPKGIIGDDGIPMHMRDPHGGHYYDIRAANIRTANSGLLRELKGRHLQMIAIGGSIGMSIL